MRYIKYNLSLKIRSTLEIERENYAIHLTNYIFDMWIYLFFFFKFGITVRRQ